MHKLYFILAFFLAAIGVKAQELKALVSVLSNRVANNVDKKTFTTLQTALESFVNDRKWTSDNFGQQEKIDCSFLLNLQSTDQPNVYKASLTVQSARPIFNSTYNSPLVNFQDNDITFSYVEFQPLDFNDNRVSGSDPLSANLTAV